MIIKPKFRQFICTTAHPKGCAFRVEQHIEKIQNRPTIEGNVKSALIIGGSSGYGLASRIVLAYGCAADTLSVSFERAGNERRTATAGWYNDAAFSAAVENLATTHKSLNLNAFSPESKEEVIKAIRSTSGKIDLLVYSLAAPVRVNPQTGETQRSSIKPIGSDLHIKNLDVHKSEINFVDLPAATEKEIEDTVAVMGGDDWALWINALKEADVLSDNFETIAYSYIGSELTWPIYWNGTLGEAKRDLERHAAEMTASLEAIGGKASVVVLPSVVTQASVAIPVVSLYNALLFKVQKEQGVYEQDIDHIDAFFRSNFFSSSRNVDDQGRIRADVKELDTGIQNLLIDRWNLVETVSIPDYCDIDGVLSEFFELFGFGYNQFIDYEEDISLG